MNAPGWMIIAAFRYYLGRMTIQTHNVAQWYTNHWDELPQHAQDIIKRDLSEAIDSDTRSREKDPQRERTHALGMDMDRPVWIRLYNRINL